MNRHPFISSNLNIYDETRCIFSSTFIAGQPVIISQEQNRKICDTTMTAISSNQHPIGNCYCASQRQPPSAMNQQPWPCALQAQKHGVPDGVMFNFAQPNCIPSSCIPTAYTPPPLPAPQIVTYSNKTPQTLGVDFGRYGLEAMMFQEQFKRHCSFSYDKKVGTSDPSLNTKKNHCCCGTQSTSLTVDQKRELFDRVDETNCKQKLKINPSKADSNNRKECVCFPKPDPYKYEDTKTLIIRERRENRCRNYNTVNQASKNSNTEETSNCDYQDEKINRPEISRPTCLRKYDGCSRKNEYPKKCVSFSTCDKTLIISEDEESEHSNCTNSIPCADREIDARIDSIPEKKSLQQNILIEDCASEEDISDDTYQCNIIRRITLLKRRRKGILRMYSFFNDNLVDSLHKIDNEIQDLRQSCNGGSFQEPKGSLPKSCATSKLQKSGNFRKYNCLENTEDVEEVLSVEKTVEPVDESLIIIKEEKDDIENLSFRIDHFTIPPPTLVNQNDNDLTELRDMEKKLVTPDKQNEENQKYINGESLEVKHVDETIKVEKEIGILIEEMCSVLTDSCNKKNCKSIENQDDQPFKNIVETNRIENVMTNDNQNVMKYNDTSENIPIRDKFSHEFNDPNQVEPIHDSEKKTGTDRLGRNGGIEGTSYEMKKKVYPILNEETSLCYEDENKPCAMECRRKKLNQINSKNAGSQQIHNDSPEANKVENFDKKNTNESIQNEASQNTLNLDQLVRFSINSDQHVTKRDFEVKANRLAKNDNDVTSQEVKIAGRKVDKTNDILPSTSIEKRSNRNDRAENSYNEQKIDSFGEIENKAGMLAGRDDPEIHQIDVRSDTKNEITELEDNAAEERNAEETNVPSPACCPRRARKEPCGEKLETEMENLGDPLIFQPCTCGRNFVSKCGNIISTILTESMDKVWNIWQNGNTSPPQASIPMNPNPYNPFCNSEGIDKYISRSGRSNKICRERLGTNRICGQTCYDVENNLWYSCCSHNEENVVQITFRETAERKTVLLKNSCRNSRFHVVYE